MKKSQMLLDWKIANEFHAQAKKYTGEVQVVFQINEDERDIFE